MAKQTHKKPEHDHHDDHGHAGGHGGGGHDDHGGGHCPPPWIITFADMATLLMAFFVIMLMTAKTDQPKFNAFAAVMRETFGSIPQDERDGQGGLSIINLSPGPQSGEETDEPPATSPQSGNPEIEDSGRADGTRNPGGATGSGDSESDAATQLGKALQDALAQGEMTIASDEGEVVVKLPPGSGASDAAAFAAALEQAINAQGQGSAPQPAGTGAASQPDGAGADQTGAGQTGTAPSGAPQSGDAQSGSPQSAAPATAPAGTEGQGASGGGGDTGRGGVRAEIAEIQIGAMLQPEIDQGEVKVERQDGKIVVTVGAGGAFASGSADLTAQARAIIAELERSAREARRIVITGHTDTVPVGSGAFRDNWDLAAARAQSVLREIEASGVVQGAELEAVSKGETQPVADNETPEGREQNRRIEIEIEFD